MSSPRLSYLVRPYVILILIALVAFAPGEAENEDHPVCPPTLRAWRMHGSADAGDEWAAEILEVRGDVGILREVLIRLGEGKLTSEEARWFDAPPVLEPTDLRTRTMSFVGDDLLSYCRDLTGSEIEALRERSRSRCFVNDSGGVRMTVGGAVTVTNADTDASTRLTSDAVGAYFDADEAADIELTCEPMEKLVSTSEDEKFPSSGPSAVDAIYDMLEQMEAIEGQFDTGLAAVPTARHVLATLREHDGERVPDSLPSDFYLTVAAASGSYAEALALERMLTATGTDEEVALKLLGDFATPAATPLLLLRLRTSIVEDRDRVAALTLRGLLAADRHVARREAVPLLADPRFVRPALGVFALTDPVIKDTLQSLDPSAPEELREAGARLLAHLAAAAADDDVRRAAAAFHGEP